MARIPATTRLTCTEANRPTTNPSGRHGMTTLHQLTATTPGLPCRTTDPDLFHSNYARDRRTAAALCAGCPLRADCYAYAVEQGERWGVWGGHDFTAVVTHCGTERGHQIHVRNRERPCEPCVEAHAVEVTRRRRERLAAEHAKGGTVRGYEIHRALGESPCDACRTASGRASRERRERAQRAAVAAVADLSDRRGPEPLPSPHAAVHGLALAG